MKVGDRVGAILKADKESVCLLGYGVYDGELEGSPVSIPNPRITLDNGSVVWGCQCWWGSEEKMKEWIGNREIIPTKLED